MRIVCSMFCFLWIFSVALCAQNKTPEQIEEACNLEDSGNYDGALALLTPIITSGDASGPRLAQIWAYAGYAYQEKGAFGDAQHAYEQAARIASSMPSGKVDYATALDNLADFTQARGKLRPASRLEQKALHLFLQNKDHAGAAWAYLHLAVIELTRKHSRNAERYLQLASQESLQKPRPGGDYDAAFYSARAWLSELHGNSLTAISEYQQSIALQPCKDCVLSGWTYVLLGKTYSETGQLALALETMRHGLSILDNTSEQPTPRYLAAKSAYAQLLDELGGHGKATLLGMSIRTEPVP